MNTNLAYKPNNAEMGILIQGSFTELPGAASRRSTSIYMADGRLKPTAADPIRSLDDIHAMQEYYLSHNELRNYTLFTIGILFGVRAGDLLNLRIHHIMLPDGRFKSHCDMIESKTRKFNNPAITPQIRELFANYLATLPSYSMDDPVFRSRCRDRKTREFKPLTIMQLNRILQTAARVCNVPGHISSHSLRKTFAYHMLKSNPDSDAAKFAVQSMLNHADFKTTLIYCGITQEEVDGFRAGLGSYFTSGASGATSGASGAYEGDK